MADLNDEQFTLVVFMCGNPPHPRPPAFTRPRDIPNVSTRFTWPIRTLKQKHDWETWAVECRLTALKHGWIAGIDEWSEWLRNFLAWYDAALTIITAE